MSLDPAKIAAAAVSLAIGHLASWCAVLTGGPAGPLRLLHAAHADPAAGPALQWLLEHASPPARPGSGPAVPQPDDELGAGSPNCPRPTGAEAANGQPPGPARTGGMPPGTGGAGRRSRVVLPA